MKKEEAEALAAKIVSRAYNYMLVEGQEITTEGYKKHIEDKTEELMEKDRKKELIKVAKKLDKLGICPICILQETLEETEALMWANELETLTQKLHEMYGDDEGVGTSITINF